MLKNILLSASILVFSINASYGMIPSEEKVEPAAGYSVKKKGVFSPDEEKMLKALSQKLPNLDVSFTNLIEKATSSLEKQSVLSISEIQLTSEANKLKSNILKYYENSGIKKENTFQYESDISNYNACLSAYNKNCIKAAEKKEPLPLFNPSKRPFQDLLRKALSSDLMDRLLEPLDGSTPIEGIAGQCAKYSEGKPYQYAAQQEVLIFLSYVAPKEVKGSIYSIADGFVKEAVKQYSTMKDMTPNNTQWTPEVRAEYMRRYVGWQKRFFILAAKNPNEAENELGRIENKLVIEDFLDTLAQKGESLRKIMGPQQSIVLSMEVLQSRNGLEKSELEQSLGNNILGQRDLGNISLYISNYNINASK